MVWGEISVGNKFGCVYSGKRPSGSPTKPAEKTKNHPGNRAGKKERLKKPRWRRDTKKFERKRKGYWIY